VVFSAPESLAKPKPLLATNSSFGCCRTWTSERLWRHGLQDDNLCALCSQEPETSQHLLLCCSYRKEVWAWLLRQVGFQYIVPLNEGSLVDWWIYSRKQILKEVRKGFDSFLLLTTWHIWKERNARVFQGDQWRSYSTTSDH
jgi:hypothetical protein